MSTVETIASPEMGNARFLSLLRVRLARDESQALQSRGQEQVLDVLAGGCSVHIKQAGGDEVCFDSVGGRRDIFAAPPDFVYLPPGCAYEIQCTAAPFEAVIYTAPCQEAVEPAYLGRSSVKAVDAGTSDWSRRVYIGPADQGPARHMMVGETESPPGNWSGFPPHRHSQEQPPGELAMEELYYFQIQPQSGFVIGGVYQDPDQRAGTADLRLYGHGQAFDVPGGFHFIAPCPGYRVRYTWALGGGSKGFGRWSDDPHLAWLHDYPEPPKQD